MSFLGTESYFRIISNGTNLLDDVPISYSAILTASYTPQKLFELNTVRWNCYTTVVHRSFQDDRQSKGMDNCSSEDSGLYKLILNSLSFCLFFFFL